MIEEDTSYYPVSVDVFAPTRKEPKSKEKLKAYYDALDTLASLCGMKYDEGNACIENLKRKLPAFRLKIVRQTYGVSRWLEAMGEPSEQQLAELNSLLECISLSPAIDYLDHDFNGMSYDDVRIMLNIDKRHRPYCGAEDYTYRVIPIDTFEQAESFRKYAPAWYILQNVHALQNDIKQYDKLYFCVRNDMEQVPALLGEGFPADDYGLSFIAVFIDSDGYLEAITRWNIDFNCLNDCDYSQTEERMKTILGDAWKDIRL